MLWVAAPKHSHLTFHNRRHEEFMDETLGRMTRQEKLFWSVWHADVAAAASSIFCTVS